MIFTEWNWDDALEVAREEGHEDGFEEGFEKSRQYFLEMINQGLSIEEIKQRLTKETPKCPT
jgi:flagellar biosynthesis/type III secretory pathway protein FliH